MQDYKHVDNFEWPLTLWLSVASGADDNKWAVWFQLPFEWHPVGERGVALWGDNVRSKRRMVSLEQLVFHMNIRDGKWTLLKLENGIFF